MSALCSSPLSLHIRQTIRRDPIYWAFTCDINLRPYQRGIAPVREVLILSHSFVPIRFVTHLAPQAASFPFMGRHSFLFVASHLRGGQFHKPKRPQAAIGCFNDTTQGGNKPPLGVSMS